MKILLITILLFCTQAMAVENWVKKSGVKDPLSVRWMDKSKCESQETETCLDITGKDLRKWMVGQVDNPDSPKYLKMDVSACSGLENCQTNLTGKDCLADHGEGSFGVINQELTEAYCAKPNGFNQMDALVADAAGTTAADAEDAVKAAKAVEEENISAVKKAMDCGRDVMAVMAIRNIPKGLSKGQKKTLLSTYADAKSFLEVGSLAEAKSEVEAATPDGVIVTADDKTAIIAKIDECLQ